MQGYPKVVATKKDYENLLKIPEFAGRAKTDLASLALVNTEKVTRAIRPVDVNKPDGNWVTEEIDNPSPIWKRKGFETTKEISGLANIALPAAGIKIKPPVEVPVAVDNAVSVVEVGTPNLGSRIAKGISDMAKKFWPKR
jgi:hypothetical protein